MQHKRESVHSLQVASEHSQHWRPFLKRVAVIGSVGSIVIALLGLLSYLPGLALLGSISEGYIPMAPSTAISFIMLGSIILTMNLRSLSGAILHLFESLAGLVSLFGALDVAGHFIGRDLNFEDMLVPAAGYIGDIAIARMSPSTAALFFLAGLAVLALLWRTRNDARGSILGHWAGGLGSLVIFTGTVFCLAYLFGSPLFYGSGATIPMALTTALGFLMLGAATVGVAGEAAIPVSLLGTINQSDKPMGARRRFILLALIMLTATGAGITIILLMLYRHDIEERRFQLQASVQSQARLIESIARHDFIYEQNVPGGPLAATLDQIIDAHENYEGFGDTGDFTLARRDGENIVFELRHTHTGVEHPTSVPIKSELAIPMQMALKGLSGTIIALDYRGETVLAAYEPVALLKYGIVAKIDMAEIRNPFIRSALSAISVAMLFIMAGTVLFFQISTPIITRLEAHSRDLENEIVERKHAEEELRISEQKHKRLSNEIELIFDHLPGLVFYKDLKNKFVRVNKYVATSYQMQKYELEGMSLFDLHTKDQAQIYWDDDLEVARSGKAKLDIVEPWDTAEGLKWLNTSKIPFINEKGDVIGIIGVSMDFTKRKQAEESLRESEEKYRSLIEQASDGIFICDHEGVLSEVNLAGRLILGFADEDPSGSNIRDYLHTDNQDDNRIHLDEWATGHGILHEYGVTRKDGSEIQVEINAIRMFNNQIQGIVRDITKRKQAEKEREHLLQKLIEHEAGLKALSYELVRSQEQERRQIARELHDDVGQQLMAAKLRLKKYSSKSGSKSTAKEITETLEYLDDTLAIVRNLSLNLHPTILDELGLAAALRWLIDRQLKISDYKIQLKVGKLPESLSAETAITIFRVTQEALNNISRHAEATEVLIKVRTNRGIVKIEISDNGLGFNVQEAIKIAVSGGSLGLLSMRERASYVDGKIDIESVEGDGTIIRGSFPLNK